MSLDKAAVAKIAKLARLKMEPDRQEALASELNRILSFVEELQAVNTDNVQPMTSVAPMKLRHREDAVTDGGKPEAVLKNAPQRQGDFYTVPKVVE
ncbi:Asp-tRNA(Asn)/Glu-tRNA(Gln) amidotransferase subunit GatC [Ferrovibrio terrae]|jgi:aspartyl-tRNA(Asn)/glutamyl-tRNA(Gln) amidotransferase subunit C|uniref:Aspartyl/glutamyl-tRNA(Asn/Gln) amidotransferase subunit C n=1 Tax=Ferrovibrio terrae TaxID=2594003 RepID=A0A516H4M9_9PROT|nr:Asp-tRNA(Asn)/Glu-tRNA(Gln) amidotransferase subunit GatC [Ferrovibrio terrae]QDO98706.1 Asp-tRNA(Asn)/Glu-tRNA(Gln) amidotransferase subunit GatC [Ferrovibrio terrae]